MNDRRNISITNRRHYFLFPALAVLLIFSVVINIMYGTVKIEFQEIINILFRGSSNSTALFILENIRIPRIAAATLGGGYLAVSGLLMQVFFRNPVVGPFVLGISSGATLFVGIVMLTGLGLGLSAISPFVTVLSAFAGSCFIMLLVIFFASRVKSIVTLLITGIMMGYVASAVTSILITFASSEKIKGFVLWGMGSFTGFGWDEIQVLFFLGGAVFICVFIMSKPLNAFLLGEEYAASMGVNIKGFRIFLLISSCALASIVTAGAGPVGFIGLAVPHMARLVFKTSNNRILIPACMILGGVVTGMCDFFARTALSPAELPISSITAVFGAPIVMWLIMKGRAA